ncbi:MAG TPA: aldolase/citrate lyase family protein [Nitrososphaerales archaeon]|nr:aldolase/citrate lyase family protein [Nitrososphaerales archaeon]
MKNLIEAAKRGEPLIGTVIVSSSPANVEISGYLGYDFVFIDTEHAPVSPVGSELENLIRSAYAADIAPVVRVVNNDRSQVRKALDFGAKGIICPFVNTKEDAQKWVGECLFPPLGTRGGAPVVRATKYGAVSWSEYVKRANAETIVCGIIERKQGLQNMDEICSVKGLNAILCGPFDLAMELNILMKGDQAVSETLQMLTDPTVLKHVDTMIATAKRHGLVVGNIAWSAANAADMIKRGCNFVAVTGDNNMFIEIAKKYLDDFRSLLK